MSQSVLANLYSRSLAVDVVLKVDGDDRGIKAHRNILMGASQYFEALFTTDFKERDSPEIVLKELRFEALKTVIDFVYTGELTLGCSFFEAVVAADYLMVDCVKLKLNNYATKATTDNCIDVYGAYQYLNVPSKVYLEVLICQNLKMLMITKEFSTMNVDQLLNILSNTMFFVVLPQMDTISAINLWVLAAPEERFPNVYKLLSKIVFKTTMTVTFIMDKIAPICKTSESKDFLIALLARNSGYTGELVNNFFGPSSTFVVTTYNK